MENWKHDFELICEQYKNSYNNILKIIYPSINNYGFTERNLTCNFAKAYEGFYNNDKSIATWFEFKFNNTLLTDCIIINTSMKEIFIVESKRINVTKKLGEIGEDIKRIFELYRNREREFKDRIYNYTGDYKIFGVILTDIWPLKGHNAFKNKIDDLFLGNKLFAENSKFYKTIFENNNAQEECKELNSSDLLYNVNEVDTNGQQSNYKLKLFTLCWKFK